MINIKNDIDFNNNIEKIIQITENQIAVKFSNPSMEVGGDNPFQTILCGFNNEDEYEYDSLIFVPMIEQYYHNFFEIFSRVLLLREHGEDVKVVLVREDKIEDGLFYSLMRDHEKAERNAAHLKDFFEFSGIDFICINNEDLKNIKCKSTFAFFSFVDERKDERDMIGNQSIVKDGRYYSIGCFLYNLRRHIFLENVEILRRFFPKYVMQKGYKIFISRSKATVRKYEQEGEFEKIAKDLGYVVVHLEDLSLLEQVAMIQSASHIICPYGSALVNVTLCTNQKVLSVNYTPDYFVGTYEAFMSEYGIKYKAVQINPEEPISIIKDIILDWEN